MPKYELGRAFMTRIPEGDDVISHLISLASRTGIKVAYVDMIGIVKDPVIVNYDYEANEARTTKVEGYLTIGSASGNISTSEDGKPAVHIHAVLSDGKRNTYVGGLKEGKAFVVEVFIQELLGDELVRRPYRGPLNTWIIKARC